MKNKKNKKNESNNIAVIKISVLIEIVMMILFKSREKGNSIKEKSREISV